MTYSEDAAGCPEVLKISAPPGYGEFGAGERHGSYEKTWSSKNGELTRFVVAALTPCQGAGRLEVWFGADDGQRFVRKFLTRYSVDDPENPESWLTQELTKVVGQAAKEASRLTEGDLRETRSVPPAVSETQFDAIAAVLGRLPEGPGSA